MLEIGDITEGVPATFALEFCKRNRFTCYVVWNNTLVAKHEPEHRAHVHACALTIVGGHAVIHRCAKSFAHMKVGEVAPLPEKNSLAPSKARRHPSMSGSLGAASPQWRAGTTMTVS